MKYAYTPRDSKKNINVVSSSERYNCEAYDYFREK